MQPTTEVQRFTIVGNPLTWETGTRGGTTQPNNYPEFCKRLNFTLEDKRKSQKKKKKKGGDNDNARPEEVIAQKLHYCRSSENEHIN